MFLPSQTRYIVILLLAFAFAGTDSAEAQSLFERRSPLRVDQFRSITATSKGDLLTIVINEATDVENIDLRSLDKTGNASASGNLGYSLGGGLGSNEGDGSITQSSSAARNFSGDSEFRSEREFNDRFTVVVKDVLPNGNLVVAGKRRIMLHGDSRVLTLTGIVRTVDLLPGNTVSSNLVANLNVALDGKGPEQKFLKQGWFSRRINRLWPF